MSDLLLLSLMLGDGDGSPVNARKSDVMNTIPCLLAAFCDFSARQQGHKE
jgi:hypothetical protein